MSISQLSYPCQRKNRWNGRLLHLYIKSMMIRHRLQHGSTIYYMRDTTTTLNMIRYMRRLSHMLGHILVYELHQIQHLDIEHTHCLRHGKSHAFRRYKTERKNMETAAYQCVDGLITIGQRLVQLMRGIFGINRQILVAPSGVRLPESGIPPRGGRKIDICYMGSLQPYNGIDILIRAMTELSPYRLSIIGSGKRVDESAISARRSDPA
jgi:glycosyltransferase involved in cell wall biosynthesis